MRFTLTIDKISLLIYLIIIVMSTATVASALLSVATNVAKRQKTALSSVAARTALDEHSTTGEFKRVDAAWRNWISQGGLNFV